MYSFTRSLIGAKLARMRDPRQGRRQHDQRHRQPVDAELVLDAEERDPVELLDVLEGQPGRRPVGQVAQQQPEVATQVASAKPSAARRSRRTWRRGRIATTSAPTSGRNVMTLTGSGSRRRSSSPSLPGRDEEVRAGHHDQPDRDAQRVVLDPAGLDPAQAAAGVDGRGGRRR